jgi:hypothetical protein
MSRFLLVVCTLILLSTSQTFAQQAMEDVVHLKNGGVIRGIIVEQIPGETLKIQTRDGNIFAYRFDEIAKITKEPMRGVLSVTKKKDPLLAFGLSFLITGGGQFYNGQYGKGILQLGAVLVGISLVASAGDSHNHPYDSSEEDEAQVAFGTVMILGGYLWSLIDAPISANRINQESQQPSYGHMIQLDGDRLILGIDVTARHNTPNAMLTLHF